MLSRLTSVLSMVKPAVARFSLSLSLFSRMRARALSLSVCVRARALVVDVEGLHQVVYDASSVSDALAEGTPSFPDEVEILSRVGSTVRTQR